MPVAANPIEHRIWELSRLGLDQIDGTTFDQLIEFARANRFFPDDSEDGWGNAADPRNELGRYATAFLRRLDERGNPFGELLDQDAGAKLDKILHAKGFLTGGQPGRKVSIPRYETPSWYDLSRVRLDALPRLLRSEMRERWDITNRQIPAQVRADRLFALVSDYAQALLVHPHSAGRDAVRERLMDMIRQLPDAQLRLLQDSDGDDFADLVELFYGTNPEGPQYVFENPEDVWGTYQNMNGSFYAISAKLSEYLADPAIAEHERKSAVAWLIGEQAGNTIRGSLRENEAIYSTAGLDFCQPLYPYGSPVQDMKLDKSFEIAVDFLDSLGNFVALGPQDHLEVRYRDGDGLADVSGAAGAIEVGYEVVESNAGEDESALPGDQNVQTYRPVFLNADGEEIAPEKVMLVVVDGRGRIKGDGKVSGMMSTGWWGFCDRNALVRLVNTKYPFKKPTKDVVLTHPETGNTLKLTAKEIQDVAGRRLTEIFPTEDSAGYRYDDELDTVALKDEDVVLRGKLGGNIELRRRDAVREGDTVIVRDPGDGTDAFGIPIQTVYRLVEADGTAGKLKGIAPKDAANAYTTAIDLDEDQLDRPFRPNVPTEAVAWGAPEDEQAAQSLKSVLATAYRAGLGLSRESVPAEGLIEGLLPRIYGNLAEGKQPFADLSADWSERREVAKFILDLDLLNDDLLTELATWLRPALDAVNAAYEAAEVGGAAPVDPIALVAEVKELLGGEEQSFWPLLAAAFGSQIPATSENAERRAQDLAGSMRFAFRRGDAQLKQVLQRRLAEKPAVLVHQLSLDKAIEKVGSYRQGLADAREAAIASKLEELADLRILKVDTRRGRGRSATLGTGLQYSLHVSYGDHGEDTWEIGSDRVFAGDIWGYRERGEGSADARVAFIEAMQGVIEELKETAPVTRTKESMRLPPGATVEQKFKMKLQDGTTREIRSSEIAAVAREDVDDILAHVAVAHFMRHGGATGADSASRATVSNGLRALEDIRSYTQDDPEAPEWVTKVDLASLVGHRGSIDKTEAAEIKFYDLGKDYDHGYSSMAKAWIAFDEDNMPINSGWLAGGFDFLWTIMGKPDWDADPQMNPYVPNELVLQLYINSVEHPEKMAEQGLLPADWERYLVPQPR